MGTGGAAGRSEMPDSGAPQIRVTRSVNVALRELRATAPRAAREVDDLIKNIPDIPSERVRIVGPEPRQDREYQAAVPRSFEAPVIIYRPLLPSEDPQGDWLVTTLIDRKEYEEYRRAEVRGYLDDPLVRDVSNQVGGKVADLIINTEQGGDRPAGGTR
jgi:hypothetical protein